MGLKETLEHQQKVLELQLAVARERFQHHGLRGGAVEFALRSFIEANLPRALSVGTGEVIATLGDDSERTSRQLDVVISNEMQPFAAGRDEATVLLIEGINAAGEVKSTLNGGSKFDEELKKGRTFKSLRSRNLSGLVSIPKPDSWASYYVHYRPYFIFTFETSVKWRRLLLKTCDYILSHKKIPYDALFIMDEGIVILISPFIDCPFSKLAGIPFFHESEELGKTIGGIYIYETTAFLAFFLMWLSTFRSTFYGARSALPYYLEAVVNDSMSDIVLAQSKHESQEDFISEMKTELESDPLKSLTEYLRRDLDGDQKKNASTRRKS